LRIIELRIITFMLNSRSETILGSVTSTMKLSSITVVKY